MTSYVQRVRVSLTSVTMQVTDPVKWISERIEFFDQKNEGKNGGTVFGGFQYMIIPCILPGGKIKSLSFAQIVHNCPKHDNSSEIIFKKNPKCLKERYAGGSLTKFKLKTMIKEEFVRFHKSSKSPPTKSRNRRCNEFPIMPINTHNFSEMGLSMNRQG